jgi:hypothetical protein
MRRLYDAASVLLPASPAKSVRLHDSGLCDTRLQQECMPTHLNALVMFMRCAHAVLGLVWLEQAPTQKPVLAAGLRCASSLSGRCLCDDLGALPAYVFAVIAVVVTFH